MASLLCCSLYSVSFAFHDLLRVRRAHGTLLSSNPPTTACSVPTPVYTHAMKTTFATAAAGLLTVGLLATAGLGGVCGAPAEDLVSGASLPGWNRALPSKIYSGFVNASSSKRLHYMLVEAEAPLDPATAPLVLWLNGGPGCSSLEGFLYEHGPLNVADAHAPPNANHAGDPSPFADDKNLVANAWSWSKAANMLYLEAPAGVGFSYSSTGNPKDLVTGDNQTATDNLAALNSFFKLFPEYSNNTFMVSGESYGGVYVPTLSLKIYEAAARGEFGGNMRGYLVGNGVFDFKTAAAATVPFAYGHSFIGDVQNAAVTKACAGGYIKPTPACSTQLNKVRAQYVDTNGYDAYRTCYQPPSDIDPGAVSGNPAALIDLFAGAVEDTERGHANAAVHAWMRARHMARRASLHSVGENVPCINSVKGTEYLNREDVKQALHVEASPNTWAVCGGVTYKNDGVYTSMIDLHKEMLTKYSPRILVYNGDVDPGCNYIWGERSVVDFGLAPNTDEAWRPWTYDDKLVGPQLGGFVSTYGPRAQGVLFTTVHGAGHMSPQWRPEAVFHMFQRFLAAKPL